MQKSKKDWLVINVGSAPVYDKPNFNSSCLTEVVYGESCMIIDKNKNWFYIECEDGYKGWVNSFYGIKKININQPNYIIAYPDKNGNFQSNYPFGAKLDRKLPGCIPIREILEIDKIIPTAENLLGVPYKWGGKTSLGFDCSGLVQSVLKVCGLNVPRDSHQQWEYFFSFSDTIDLLSSEPGDIHFFGLKKKITHVGLSTGGTGILHSQGSVKRESLDPKHDDFNAKLLDIYLSTYSIKCKFQQ